MQIIVVFAPSVQRLTSQPRVRSSRSKIERFFTAEKTGFTGLTGSLALHADFFANFRKKILFFLSKLAHKVSRQTKLGTARCEVRPAADWERRRNLPCGGAGRLTSRLRMRSPPGVGLRRVNSYIQHSAFSIHLSAFLSTPLAAAGGWRRCAGPPGRPHPGPRSAPLSRARGR